MSPKNARTSNQTALKLPAPRDPNATVLAEALRRVMRREKVTMRELAERLKASNVRTRRGLFYSPKALYRAMSEGSLPGTLCVAILRALGEHQLKLDFDDVRKPERTM